MIDFARLFQDYGVDFVTSDQHHHVTRGWLGVHCPFCPGPRNYHLGISPTGGCYCWRCGKHTLRETLSALLGVPESQVGAILRKYGGGRIILPTRAEPRVSIRPLRFPNPYSEKLTGRYAEYLAQRGFDPEKLNREWRVCQTGPVSYLDGIDFSYRILIPIYWDGEVVSFQTRDITERARAKYMACPREREIRHHKEILYVHPDGPPDDRVGIIVEGVTDVWRLGRRAMATFGIEFKLEQVLTIAEHLDRIFVIFDPEPQAHRQARKLAVRLRMLGKEVLIIDNIPGSDPGAMSQKDADRLVRELTRRYV